MHYVYVIQAGTNGSYYVGSTRDVNERLKKHNEGRSPYTKSKGNWKLVYVEKYKTSGEAMAREKEIKGKKSRKYLVHLVRTSPAFGGGRSKGSSLVGPALIVSKTLRLRRQRVFYVWDKEFRLPLSEAYREPRDCTGIINAVCTAGS